MRSKDYRKDMTYIIKSVQLYKPPIVYKNLYELRTYNTRFAVAGYWLQAKVILS